MARLPLLDAAALLELLAAAGARGAYLNRPEQDCLNPMVSKVNQFNFFPDEYRSILDRSPSSGFKAPSTVRTLGARHRIRKRRRATPRARRRGRGRAGCAGAHGSLQDGAYFGSSARRTRERAPAATAAPAARGGSCALANRWRRPRPPRRRRRQAATLAVPQPSPAEGRPPALASARGLAGTAGGCGGAAAAAAGAQGLAAAGAAAA